MSVAISQFIDDIISYNASHSHTTDVSGILIFDVTNNAGHSWGIITGPSDIIYEETDISDASLSSAYFLPYSSNINLVLNTIGPSTDALDFFLIPAASMGVFSNPRININTLPTSTVDTTLVYRIFENYMLNPQPSLVDPFTITPPATVETYNTSTLPILSSYTSAQVNSVFNTSDTGLRVVDTKSEQTIAAEVKSYLNTNGALPQFKNYTDYLAYKKAINLQNSLLQRYG